MISFRPLLHAFLDCLVVRFLIRVFIILFRIFLLLYIIVFMFSERIETYVTFPRAGYEAWHFASMQDVTHFFLTDSDGYQISTIFLDQKSPDTVVYFHGNGENINDSEAEIRIIASYGYNILEYDYPGYGESEGVAYEDRVQAFSDATYDYLTTDRKITPEHIIAWGHSIGTAVAVDFAARHPVKKLALFAPFTSRYDMSRKIFGVAIQPYVGRANSFVSVESVRSITMPTLIIHGDADQVIPYSMGREVYASSASADKRFITIRGGKHNNMVEQYGSDIDTPLRAFLAGKPYTQDVMIGKTRY